MQLKDNPIRMIKTINSEVEVFPCHDWPFKDGDSRALELISHHNQRLNILKNDVKGIKKKISTPAEALSWLGFLNNYKHTVEVNLPVDLWSMSRYENIRKGLYSFHTEMQIQLEFRRLSLKYAGIKDRNLNVKEILGEDNYHKIMNIFNDKDCSWINDLNPRSHFNILNKDEILELYLNDIYLGYGSYGIGTASLNYFNKSI